MTQRARQLFAVCFVFAALVGQAPRMHAQSRADLDARIARVETGLRFPVTIRGKPPVRMRLDRRMRDLKVPGVSIARHIVGQ